MNTPDDILSKILNDLRVELADEFDKNFERKGFFNEKWEDRKHDGKGSLMFVTGKCCELLSILYLCSVKHNKKQQANILQQL